MNILVVFMPEPDLLSCNTAIQISAHHRSLNNQFLDDASRYLTCLVGFPCISGVRAVGAADAHFRSTDLSWRSIGVTKQSPEPPRSQPCCSVYRDLSHCRCIQHGFREPRIISLNLSGQSCSLLGRRWKCRALAGLDGEIASAQMNPKDQLASMTIDILTKF